MPQVPSPDLTVLQRMVAEFRDERDWAQFHTLKDLAAGLAVEAAELQEELLWVRADEEGSRLEQRRAQIEAELADVVIMALNFANAAEVDLGTIVLAKLRANAERYPAATVRGSAVRYRERRGTDEAR